MTISLESRTGHVNMKAVAGMMLFTQYWYWFPLAHCLALSFTPTTIIALNSKLKVSSMVTYFMFVNYGVFRPVKMAAPGSKMES